MKRCFGYVRVSTQKQGEGVSLDAQREAIEAFSGVHGLTITKWFEEKETAAKSGRPIFTGMIKALRRGEAEGVVIHKIDRSARNFADWAKIGELADAGVDVHFATESLDFRSRGGRLSADIQAVIAADYIRNLREETIKGISGRLKQGLYPFRAPIGYLDNGGGKPKTIDPVRGPLIREMFELYASGQHSFRSLQAEMERRGLRNRTGKPLSKTGIETILSNPFYCGLIRIRRSGAVYQGVHEKLISASLYQAVQDVRTGKHAKKVTQHNHTYRGLFRCEHCKTAMIPERQKGHVYYRCQTRECVTKCVREESLEASVQEVLLRIQLTDNDIATLTREMQVWCEKRAQQSEISNTGPMRLQAIDDRLERLTDALIDRLINKEAYEKRKKALLLERTRVEESIGAETNERDSLTYVERFLELIKSLAATYLFANAQEKRQIVQVATSNRSVSGKYVHVEPANWLIAAENALIGLTGVPHRTTSRSSPRLRDRQLKDLQRFVCGEEAVAMMNTFDELKGDAEMPYAEFE